MGSDRNRAGQPPRGPAKGTLMRYLLPVLLIAIPLISYVVWYRLTKAKTGPRRGRGPAGLAGRALDVDRGGDRWLPSALVFVSLAVFRPDDTGRDLCALRSIERWRGRAGISSKKMTEQPTQERCGCPKCPARRRYARSVVAALTARGAEVRFVGGCVRDVMSGEADGRCRPRDARPAGGGDRTG